MTPKEPIESEFGVSEKAEEPLKAALERIIGMCDVPSICPCGRPNGLPAIVSCAKTALLRTPAKDEGEDDCPDGLCLAHKNSLCKIIADRETQIADLQAQLNSLQRDHGEELAEKEQELTDHKDATNISPARLQEILKENTGKEKRIEELNKLLESCYEFKWHRPDCNYYLDDESDFENLLDAGMCTCKGGYEEDQAKLKSAEAVVEAAMTFLSGDGEGAEIVHPGTDEDMTILSVPTPTWDDLCEAVTKREAALSAHDKEEKT